MPTIKLTPTPDLKSRIKAKEPTMEELLKLLDTIPTGKTTDSQRKAIQKWHDKHPRMTLRIPQDLKKQLDTHAALHEESATAFITRAIQEQIKRDNAVK